MQDKSDRQSQVVCYAKGCKGVMFDVSSRLSMAMGVKHVQCEKCKARYAVKIKASSD